MATKIETIHNKVKAEYETQTNFRFGQMLSNAFQAEPEYRDIVRELAGTKFDPFYVDENVPAFLEYLENTSLSKNGGY